MKASLIFGIALIVFGVAIQWLNDSTDADILSGILLIVGSFISGRQSKK